MQQSKLAALGRLSASIAHEIRNPVGAMSHAAQLLDESLSLDAEERRLTEIMRSNARLAAVQALYQMDIAGTPLNDIFAEFQQPVGFSQ